MYPPWTSSTFRAPAHCSTNTSLTPTHNVLAQCPLILKPCS
jgi:hypothetical protein